MRIQFVTSEVYPLAKTGGLADVSASLPAALTERGVDVRLILPAYPQALERSTQVSRVRRLGRLLGSFEVGLVSARLPDSGIPVWLVDCPQLFKRGGGLYQDQDGRDWSDNFQRFAVFAQAAALVARGAGDDDWRPEIVHGNDWHSGLLPHFMASKERTRSRSILTIHNLAYQGLFSFDVAGGLQLPQSEHLLRAGEFYGRFSFLKAGVMGADVVTTVSPTYAAEISTPAVGCGLDGVIRSRPDGVHGILNGVDYAIWDPRNDPNLPHTYSAADVSGKRVNKMMLQRELGLDVCDDAPLVAWMSRLAHQKMPDIAIEALPRLLEDGLQFALVAEGDPQYEAGFRALAERYPRQVAIRASYDEGAAHRLLAGADMLLHPVRYEPCGLSPLYAMRYGTIPIVRHVGGLVDTITDATTETLRDDLATGFSFDGSSAEALVATVRRAIALYGLPLAWRRMQANAMRQDFGWKRSAEAYAALYARTCETAPVGEPRQKSRGAPRAARAQRKYASVA